MNEPINNEPKLPKRRRLLQGGLGASPVLLTLVSRPVLGHNQCFTPSGFVSMPTSRPGGQTCLGRTPGYWKQSQHFNQWPKVAPGRYYPVAQNGNQPTKFSPFFSPSPYPANTTFLQVLGKEGGPPDDVARHIVAAVLNVEKGWAPVLTVVLLKQIWNQYMTTGGGTAGYFEPTAGVQWNHEQITAYLSSTMPL